MGKRLGYGYTKALLKVAGKPIIIHHLELLDECDDVRVVVGFNAKELIKTVLSYRKNVVFVFNQHYRTTNTLQSFYLGCLHAREYVVSLDGDLLIRPSDFKKFLSHSGELMGYTKQYSDEPVFATIKKRGQKEFVTNFSRVRGIYEWSGLMQIKKKKVTNDYEYIYQLIEKWLPIPAMSIDCREIDTPRDYENAIDWAGKLL